MTQNRGLFPRQAECSVSMRRMRSKVGEQRRTPQLTTLVQDWLDRY
ncbi:hypothetical protein ACIQUM_37340 [Amycolatopsis azurea]